MDETDTNAPDESHSLEDFREWLEADVLNDLQEFRSLQMGMARKLAAKTEEEGADLVRLNSAMVKAGRAIRQTAVLQLEVAGLRRQAGVREPAANGRAANQNGRPGQRRPGRPDYRTRENFADQDDEAAERQRTLSREFDTACMALATSMSADLAAAGRARESRQSVDTMTRFIRHVPHPETDAVLAPLRLEFMREIFGEENLEPPRLKTGPPDRPVEWMDDERGFR